MPVTEVQRKKHVERLLDIAAGAARDEWGRGWDSLGVRLQKALLAEAFLYLCAAQDEDTPAEIVRGIMDAAWDRIVEVGA